jgi:vacuolar-type H+-ATPase subunit I/STV1
MGSQISAYQGLSEMPNYDDDKYYCWKHKKDMIRKYKKEISDKLKEQSKNEKIKKKLEENKLKALEKQKLKLEKKLLKLQTKANKINKTNKAITKNKNECNIPINNEINLENIVLGPLTLLDISGNITQPVNKSGCNEVLKCGPKKGECCGCKIYQNELCRRHYRLKYKDVNEESDTSS